MVLWAAMELSMSAVWVYGMAKSMYNMYCDAEEMKNQYRKYVKTTDQYIKAQTDGLDRLTESQYIEMKNDFYVIDQEEFRTSQCS